VRIRPYAHSPWTAPSEAIVVDDTLQETLRKLMRSETESNPALNVLVADYTKYHVVLVVVGGLFLLGLILLSVFFWTRFRRAPRTDVRKWTFERKTYFYFGVLSVLVAMFLTLVVAANVSTVMNPRQGFSGSISMLRTASPGTHMDDLYRAVDTWLQSGSADTPSAVQDKIDERLAWQRPKAVICSVLLVVFVIVSALMWRALIRKSRDREAKGRFRKVSLHLLGVVMVLASLLLMLMVMGNTQGSVAPISLTLFFG
jgi:cytochrome bd-type quinol oxidase subunit 2